MKLSDYVLVDLDSGTIIANPARVVLVHDENMPEHDMSDMEIIAVADNDGISLVDFFDEFYGL